MLDFNNILVSISYAAIAGTTFFTYYRWLKNNIKCFVSRHMLILGIFLLVPAIMHLLWATGKPAMSTDDFNLVNGFFAMTISTVMLLLVYKWTENKNILYILAVYGITILAAYINSDMFLNILTLASFVVTLVVFLDLFVATSHHIKMGSILGSLYAIVSISLMAAYLMKMDYPLFLWAIPNLLLAGSLYTIYLDGKYCMLLHPKKQLAFMHHEKVILYVVFMRYMFYTVAIASLIFIAAISIHELGHAITSRMYGCEQTRIIFDLKSFPHTEFACDNFDANNALITFAGLLSTSLAGAVLWLTREEFSMNIGKLLLTYGFLISYQDFLDIGISESVISVVMLFSLLVLIITFINLSRYYIESQRPLFAEHPFQPHRKYMLNHHKAVTNVFI